MTRKVLWPILVIGILLIVMPFAISLPSKASAGQTMLNEFHPIMQPASVKMAANYYYETFVPLCGRQRGRPGRTRNTEAHRGARGTTSHDPGPGAAVPRTDFPAMAKLLESFPQLVAIFTNVPPGLDVYKPLVTTMQEKHPQLCANRQPAELQLVHVVLRRGPRSLLVLPRPPAWASSACSAGVGRHRCHCSEMRRAAPRSLHRGSSPARRPGTGLSGPRVTGRAHNVAVGAGELLAGRPQTWAVFDHRPESPDAPPQTRFSRHSNDGRLAVCACASWAYYREQVLPRLVDRGAVPSSLRSLARRSDRGIDETGRRGRFRLRLER